MGFWEFFPKAKASKQSLETFHVLSPTEAATGLICQEPVASAKVYPDPSLALPHCAPLSLPMSSAHPGTQADAKTLGPEAPAWALVTLDPVLSPVLLLVPDNVASGPALCWGTSGDSETTPAVPRMGPQLPLRGQAVLGHCPHFHSEAQISLRRHPSLSWENQWDPPLRASP